VINSHFGGFRRISEMRNRKRTVGLYAKYILPRVIDFGMRNKEATRLRAAWVPKARGEVLEVGVGSGLNLPFYSAEVKRIHGVDPSAELQRMARKRAADGNANVEFILQSAERPLPLAENSLDAVVMTWTLCSIENPPMALAEMKRVLKPDGCLIFIEHGRAPDRGVAAWQDRVTPAWKRVSGGCHLNRKVDELIVAAGFRLDEMKKFYLPGPRLATYTYQGVARRT